MTPVESFQCGPWPLKTASLSVRPVGVKKGASTSSTPSSPETEARVGTWLQPDVVTTALAPDSYSNTADEKVKCYCLKYFI